MAEGVQHEKKDHRLRIEGSEMKNVMVTGGCGFIGSNFLNYFAVRHPDCNFINYDVLDYCANTKNVNAMPNVKLVKGDLCSMDLVLHTLKTFKIDTIVHFAAQSHVDNSFGNSLTFTHSNVLGTHTLLECAKQYGKIGKFVHVSTDEVYGEVDAACTENTGLKPTNPYAATKAAAELIAKSYRRSFDLPVVITRGNNVYGPRQYPEKVIPRFIWLLSQDKKMTIQGSGKQMRTFVHCEDVARAYGTVVENGHLGEYYNIGTDDERSVHQIAESLIKIMKPGEPVTNWMEAVPDRDFNDFRYCVDTSALHSIGWQKQIQFEEGLKSTVEWYLKAFEDEHWAFINPHIGKPPIVPVTQDTPASPEKK